MKHRKLRIAWSVAWGLAAVLLVALWVRSYRRHDIVYLPDNRMPPLASSMNWVTEAASHRGQLRWASGLLVFGKYAWTWRIAPEFKVDRAKPLPTVLGFMYEELSPKTTRNPSNYLIVVPYYFPFFLTTSLSLAPGFATCRAVSLSALC
jgi:hypothetical protein